MKRGGINKRYNEHSFDVTLLHLQSLTQQHCHAEERSILNAFDFQRTPMSFLF